jgi:uncharacterized SAM-binding protein YcdF (DUF218 family)
MIFIYLYMTYIHKILPIFVLPIFLVILSILIAVFMDKKKLIYLAIGVFYIISTPIFSNSFFEIIEGRDYRKPIKIIDSADAIVVLSGMMEINKVGDSTYVEWGDPDRFFGGINLFKLGKAEKIIFTGGKMPWNKARKNEGEVLKEYANSYGIPSEKIQVTKEVQNTADEAKAVNEIIGSGKKIILVTSAFHMYRAKRLFEKQGLIVITYKVDYKVGRSNEITIMNILPDAESLKLTETGIRELIGRLFYLLNE